MHEGVEHRQTVAVSQRVGQFVLTALAVEVSVMPAAGIAQASHLELQQQPLRGRNKKQGCTLKPLHWRICF